MITSWRIAKAKYAATAFEGEGSRRAGGRWNSRGVPIIYTAASAALAALELLVHLGSTRILPEYVVFSCTFPESVVEPVQAEDLPSDWRSHPAPLTLRRFGDEWAMSRRSAVLKVPSAVIDTETNYLLNPEHRGFRRIVISAPQRFELDKRLLSQ